MTQSESNPAVWDQFADAPTADGGAAFPHDEFVIGSRGYPPERGMSLRDYFAAKAMPAVWQGFDDQASRRVMREGGVDVFKVVAESAYRMADAMLKARAA